MGAKTALLAYSGEPLADALRSICEPDQAGSDRLIELIHPGATWTPRAAGSLDNTYPAQNVAYAASSSGVDVVSDLAIAVTYPSMLPARLIEASKGRRLVTHAMHSVVDWLAFSVWHDGELIRSLSLAPDHGILENLGEPLAFEVPYWAGEHPVLLDRDDPLDRYPLPFHPLELGEHALRALFGFILEEVPRPTDIDPEEIPMFGYEITETTAL
ncbi:hypothetical protein GL307_14395 [Nocardia seriolae]|uniref:DUF6928 family protein n=1 Tax=Nocardia seriolae TaxID=37332 RepID=UPI0012BD0778|nr:hypothetical protein [Nocardia seriolae]MTL12737.1 hypothetical protein [Nocardia seriolae]